MKVFGGRIRGCEMARDKLQGTHGTGSCWKRIYIYILYIQIHVDMIRYT